MRHKHFKTIPYLSVLLSVLFLFAHSPLNAQAQPERAILVVIDGLHIDAPDRLEMPRFSELTENGTLIEKTTAIMPGHPHHGEYAEVHTSSFPNPIMMAGTIFLTPDQQMLQHSFESSAFIANTWAYSSITDGYSFVIQQSEPDAFSIDKAVELLRNSNLDFMRIHLQNVGSAGSDSYSADDDQPYKHNIWHEEAPYVHAAEEADRQLGRLISELKDMGKWEETLLVVTSDHGQTETGWHPLLPEESWLHPTLFHGPEIKQNHTIEWADQIDMIPTIADIMQVDIPNSDGGSGVVLEEVKRSADSERESSSSRLYELNEVFARYILAEAELLQNAVEHPYLNSFTMRTERSFYGFDRIMSWKEMGSIDELIQHNLEIVLEMEEKVEELEQ